MFWFKFAILSIYYPIEVCFAAYLEHKRNDEYRLTEESFQLIKSLSISAYPDKNFCPYSDYSCMDDIIRDLPCVRESQIYVMTDHNWYLIAVQHPFYLEILDFASSTGKCTDVVKIFLRFKSMFYGKKFRMMCLEDTSYPIIMALSKHGKCKILSDEKLIIHDKVNHRITAIFRNTNK